MAGEEGFEPSILPGSKPGALGRLATPNLMDARDGVEPSSSVLQTAAGPLGYRATRNGAH